MSYLPKQNSPFEVWNLQVAARTNPATLQRRIQELVRFANQSLNQRDIFDMPVFF